MSEPNERFYLDWGIDPTEQVPAADAVDAGDYTRVILGDSGDVVLTELYSDGNLFHIDYRNPDTATTMERHLQQHPGIPFGIEKDLGRSGDYQWSISYRFTGTGEHAGNLVTLSDTRGAALMKLVINADNELQKVEKNSYDDDGELHYIFEYDDSEEISDVFDAQHGESATATEAVEAVGMPAFYRNALALPSGVDRDSVPLVGSHDQGGLA